MAYFYQGNISTTAITVNGTSKFKGGDTSTPGILQVFDNDNTHYAQIQAPSIISTNYTLTLPTNDGDANQFLQTNGDGTLNWGSPSILSNGGDNRVITSNNLNEINGEENLLFDGTNLLIRESGQTQYRGDAIHIASNSATDLTITSNGTINLVSADRTTFITATSNIASVDATGIDLASGKSYQINNADVLTENGLGSGVIASSLTSVGTLNGLTVQSSTNNVDIIKLHADAGTSQTITILNDEGTSNSAIALTSNAGGITIDSSSDLEINSSAGSINIGNDVVAQAINIGSGAAARTITIGNSSSTATNLNSNAITLTSVDTLTLTDGTATFSLDGTGSTSLSGTTDLSIDSNTSITMDAPSVIFTSNTTDKPLFEIMNTTNDATGSHLRLSNKRGANNGVHADVAGTIDFFTNDTEQNNQSFGEIKVVATSATSGSEQGTMTFGIASSGTGGNVNTVLTILGGSLDLGQSIDVNGSINSSGSISCIGNLDISAGSSDTGKIFCSSDLNISGNINIDTDKKITWVNENQYISGTATGITIETNDTLIVNADTSITMDAPSVIFTSNTTENPLVIIKNTTNDTNGAKLQFVKEKGAAGADNDYTGLIEFYGDNDNQTQILFAKISGQIADATTGLEGGKLSFGVATHDGEFQNGLVLTDGSAEDEIDVSIGYGVDSLTTIAGDITITGCITQGSDASGDMYYRNASGVLTRIPVGNDNEVLTLDGAVPGWEAFSIGTLNGLTVQTSTNSADIIKLHADAGTSQTITILNDEGTSNSAIALTSNAGGITLSSNNLFYNTDTINVGINGDITSLTADGTVRNPNASTILLNSVTGIFSETNILNASDSALYDAFGYSVSISGTGNDSVAIIGAHANNDNGFESGAAYIFDKSSGSWTQIAKLVASDGAAGDWFGWSVSISGTGNDAVAIIGASRDDSYKGSSYIFDKSSGSWTQIAKLVANDGAGSDYFGGSVSISGTGNDAVAIIGAIGDDDNGSASGSSYIFDKSSGSWVQIAKLDASDGTTNDNFGNSVSISGTGNDSVAIIGAYGDVFLKGSAYIFDKSSGSWTQIAKLVASDGAPGDSFGYFVAISGTGNNAVAIIGASADDFSQGSAYIFDKSGGSWAQIDKLVASDGAPGDQFGYSVSISGTGNDAVAIIGARGDDDNGSSSGSSYIFNKSSGSWAQIEKLLASDGAANDYFGHSVAISGTGNNSLSIIGAYGNESASGSSYIFSDGNTFHWDLSGFGDDGQILNILYDNSLNSSISTQINFGTNSLATRNGLVSSIQLNENGQGISVMYTGESGSGVWRIINTGDGDIDMSSGKKITWVDDNQYISGTATGITIESNDTLLVNAGNMTLSNIGNLNISDNMTLATDKYLEWGPYTGTGNDCYIKGEPGIMTLRANSVKLIGDSPMIWSYSMNGPNFYITNYSNDATSGSLILRNLRADNSGQNGDVCGTIAFNANDNKVIPDNQPFATIIGTAVDTTSTSEKGKIEIGVACTDDGGIDTVLTITGGTNAASSTTTISGNLDVSAGVDVTGSITCSVDLDIEGDIDMATGKKITWVDDNQYISGTATGITIETDDTLVVNADTSMTFDAPSVIFQSATSAKPVLEIKNTNADTTGPTLLLNNASGTAAGSDTDVCGTIAFNANDDDGSPTNQSFATIIGTAVDTASGSEKGKIEIGVACTGDGGVDTVLTIEGGADAAGTTTTIAGDVVIGPNVGAYGARLKIDGYKNVAIGGGTWTQLDIIYGSAYWLGAGTYSVTVAATSPGRYVGTAYTMYSDERKKKDFINLSLDTAYDIIKQIKLYNYKNKGLGFGDNVELGVKAQELLTLYPECISDTTEFLPTILEYVTYNNKKFTLVNIGDVIINSKLKIFYQDQITSTIRQIHVNVVNVVGNEVEIDTVIDDDDDIIFIYGIEYDDVKTVDYNRLNLLGIGAIQKLITDKTALETKVATLENDVETLKSQVATLIANSS